MTQSEEISLHLQRGGKLTQMDALNKFGCFRLSARVHDLRAKGMNILMEMIKTKSGKCVAQYRYERA